MIIECQKCGNTERNVGIIFNNKMTITCSLCKHTTSISENIEPNVKKIVF